VPAGCLGATVAPRYRRWELDTVAPHLGRSVLEVGSGMGHFSARLATADVDRLVLSDRDPGTLAGLRTRFAGSPRIEVVQVDLPQPVPVQPPVDTVVAMNVLEHVNDHVEAVRVLAGATRPGGRVVLWVPGYPRLYGEFDRQVGHVRRYTPRTLREAVEAAGLRVLEVRPVNLLGGIAWWLAVRLGRVGHPRRWLVWPYDTMLIPVSRVLERLVRPPFGQSVVCIAEVPPS
jgi:SAM-dependent methyltransferase